MQMTMMHSGADADAAAAADVQDARDAEEDVPLVASISAQ